MECGLGKGDRFRLIIRNGNIGVKPRGTPGMSGCPWCQAIFKIVMTAASTGMTTIIA
jgi:hypothetical protein